MKHCFLFACILLLPYFGNCGEEPRPLAVGDSLPDELWYLELAVVNHADNAQFIKLFDYHDGLIIIDFWATWCSPCIRSLRKLGQLSKDIDGGLFVLPVTYEGAAEVGSFLEKESFGLSSVVGDSVLRKWFPYRGLPHQVWIKEGKVIAIPDPNYATLENVSAAIAGNANRMLEKENDLSFDPNRLIEPDSTVFSESRFIKRANTGLSGIRISSYGVVYVNVRPLFLIRESFVKDFPYFSVLGRISLEVSDTTRAKFEPPKAGRFTGDYESDVPLMEWRNEHVVTYYNRHRRPQSNVAIFRRMKRDVVNYFEQEYEVRIGVEKRERECLVLRRAEKPLGTVISDAGSPASYTLSNQPIQFLLSSLYSANYKSTLPIVDETGYDGNISIGLTCALDDIEGLKRELPAFGFELIEAEREIEMLVIKDAEPVNAASHE